jgi:hypothetical protein
MSFNPFFEVVREPLFAEFNGVKLNSGREALINAETNDVIGVVSPSYKVVENKEMDVLVQEALGNLPVLKVQDHLNPNTSKWVREIILDGDEFTFKIGKQVDTIKTKINIINGYGSNTAATVSVSAWRQVCSNGMMGFKDIFKSSYAHMTDNIVNKIRNDFSLNLAKFGENTHIWNQWTEVGFSQNDFMGFIDDITKSEINKKGLLSEKQGDLVKSLYEPTLNKYNDEETLWGAFNVLTAITSHDIKARKGSHLFSQGYTRMRNVIETFYDKFNSKQLSLI